jgi:hypothetical protein
MKTEERVEEERRSAGGSGKTPLIIKVMDQEFQREVIEKLGRLEAKVDMLVGDRQPGRMKLAEDRLRALEEHDIKRGVYDRLVNAAIAVAVSAAIALHDHLGLK